MKARPTQSRKGVKGQLPLAGSRDSVPCGVWGNAPTVPRATSIANALNKGAGSEASLPLTLRVRRRAPKLLFPQDSVKNHKIAKFRGCSQMHPRVSYIRFFTESWGSKQGLRRSPKSCTRKEHESATNSIARRGQGTASLVGFGATPQLVRGRPVCQTRSTKVQAAKRPCQ